MDTVIKLQSNGTFPKCFESEHQFNGWLEREAVVRTIRFKGDFCEDCTKNYQKRMILAGKCANPTFRTAD